MKRLLLACVFLAASSAAQNISCSLSGTVNDSGGAVFPDLEVKVASAGTGFVRTTKTNGNGFFSFADLTPATFTLSISAKGFKSYAQSGIEINSGEQRTLGVIRLQLGEVSESVQVVADVNPVQLASGDRAGVITQEDMADLAIRGRDVMDVVGLLPGVIDLTDGRELPDSQSMNDLYVLGGRSNQKNMTIDGVSNLDTGSNKSVQTMPSMDSIGEVKVLMSNYAAEYGRNSGGTITIITRGGSQQFHGSAGWWHRHEEFAANNFFNNQAGLSRPRYRFNIVNYTLSGPVYIPRIFNADRSKLFFFFSEEFQEQLVDYGIHKSRVPSGPERNGDFTHSFDVNGKLIQVDDPLNARKAFPGNLIPSSRFNTSGRNILNVFPLPNFVDPAQPNQWNYISDVSGRHPRRTEVARVDYSPRSNLQVYGRFSKYTDTEHSPYAWAGSTSDFPLTLEILDQPGFAGTLHTASTFSPTLVNEFIFGISQRKHNNYLPDTQAVSRQALGINIPQWFPAANPAGLMPSTNWGSVTNGAALSIDNSLPYYNSNTIFSFTENLSKVSGLHTLKVGIYIERTRKDQNPSANTRGQIYFDKDSNNPNDANYAYANALIGSYDKYTEASGRPQGQYRFSNYEWYLQDNWHAWKRLTLDFGIRFYHDMPQTDARHQLVTFVPSLYDPATAPVLLAPGYDASKKKVAIDPLSGAMYVQGMIGTFAPESINPFDGMASGGAKGVPPGLYSVPGLSVAPRFGFAFDPFGRGRTALRGGVGVFYDRVAGQATMDTFANPPNVLTPLVYYGTLDALAQTANMQVRAPSGVTALMGKNHLPVTYNYSVGVQQQIGRNTLLDLSYAGSLTRHALWERNINPIPIGAHFIDLHPGNLDPTNAGKALPDNFLRPYRGYGDINVYEFASTANYNSLQMSLNHRMGRNGRAGLSYTFSKTLGGASTDSEKVSPFFSPRHYDYGLMSFDRTQVATIFYNRTLPRPGQHFGLRKVGWVTDNWQVSGITRFMTGAPFTPNYTTVDGQDITGTPSGTLSDSKYAYMDIVNPKADARHMFGRPVRLDWGSSGPGFLRGPGVNNWDISLLRNLRIRERMSLQLRVESYNTFNHTQFSVVQTKAKFDATAAQVDPTFLDYTAARNPRRVQVAVRLNW